MISTSLLDAQVESRLDSLWQEYDYKNDIDKLKTLASIYTDILPSDESEGKRILGLAEDLNSSINSDKASSILMGMHCRYHQVTGNFDSLSIYAKKGIHLAQSASYDTTLAMYYNYMGMSHEKSGVLDSAINYYERALDLNIISRYALYNNLGLVHSSLENYEQSAFYLSSAIRETRKRKDINAEAIISNNLGIVYKQLGDTSTALQYLYNSIQLKDSLGDERGKLFAMVTIVDLLPKKEKLEMEAQAMEIAYRIENKFFIRYFTFAKAKRLALEGQCGAAKTLLKPLYEPDQRSCVGINE